MSQNRISGVMVSVLDSNVVDHVFEPQSGKTKDYEIGICCFSTMCDISYIVVYIYMEC
jgi:hypothetical protein